MNGFAMQQLKALWITLALGALIMGSGCSSTTEEEVRIGTNSWPGYQLLHYATHQGLWQADQIEVVPLRSASQVMLALEADVINVAALTLDETMQMMDRGLDLQIVAVMDISHGADMLLAKPHVASLKDLKGKTLVFESTALGAYLMQRALMVGGLSVDDVRLLSQNAEHHEEAFRRSDVDALITYEPFASRIKRLGGQVRFSSMDIPNEIIDVLVVRKGRLSDEQIEDLLTSYYLAFNHYIGHQDVFFEFVADQLKLSVLDTKEAFKSIVMPNAHDSAHIMAGSLKQTWPLMADVLLKAQLIQKVPSIEGVLFPYRLTRLNEVNEK